MRATLAQGAGPLQSPDGARWKLAFAPLRLAISFRLVLAK
jgi:hypothetical protein